MNSFGEYITLREEPVKPNNFPFRHSDKEIDQYLQKLQQIYDQLKALRIESTKIFVAIKQKNHFKSPSDAEGFEREANNAMKNLLQAVDSIGRSQIILAPEPIVNLSKSTPPNFAGPNEPTQRSRKPAANSWAIQ